VDTTLTHDEAFPARGTAVSQVGEGLSRQMLNKVPEVTLYFWIIKVLCTTVGETAADFLDSKLNVGLSYTTLILTGFLVPALFVQFRARRYVPGIYWCSVVLISVVGTLITDNMVDNFGISLVTSTIVFSLMLAATFAVWYAREKTLSIHTIVTTKREAFYWSAVLLTFALGTAAGDLSAERLNLGYLTSVLIFGGMIAVVYAAHLRFNINAILAFWIAYILTRPLGASIGDYLSQPHKIGGLGLGTTVTSAIFLTTILAVIVYLTVSKVDRIEKADLIELTPSYSARKRPGPHPSPETAAEPRVLVVANRTTATPALVAAVRTRASAGPARFVLLVPNPDHLVFDRISHDVRHAGHVLAEALPSLEEAAGAKVEGIVATSPNAYDDIVAVLNERDHDEIILETLPSHVSHWLHVDLPQRVAHLGYPLTTVTATH
jgi:uncharacterized membrane-anchored protein